MIPYEIIRSKRDGQELSPSEIREFIADYVAGNICEYHMAAFLMATYFRGMTTAETVALTEAYVESGEKLDFTHLDMPTSDKHSTGGVGDKVSLVLAPLVAACGVAVPMISGRGLGHTGGTLDKLESIPGMRTHLSPQECEKILRETGFFIAAQTEKMVPADKRIYSLRDVTATVESIPLIVASIMSKKLAEGTKTLLLDVKYGNGAFMKKFDDAIGLAKAMVDVGNMFGVSTMALLTDMNQPLGEYVGNALEVRESVQYLRRELVPIDLHEITMASGAVMLVLAKRASNLENARILLENALNNGDAYERFKKFVASQGGDLRTIEDLSLLPAAPSAKEVIAQSDGFIEAFDTFEIGMLGVELGAGRRKVGEIIDPRVGFRFFKKIGDEVCKGEPVAIVYADNDCHAEGAAEKLGKMIKISEEPVPKRELISSIVGKTIQKFSWSVEL